MKVKKSDITLGNYLVFGDEAIAVTQIDNEEGIRCGLLYRSTWEDARVPVLNDDFFLKNDFKRREEDGEISFVKGGMETWCKATKRVAHYDIKIRNRVFRFEGPVNSVNEFLRALNLCAITDKFSI